MQFDEKKKGSEVKKFEYIWPTNNIPHFIVKIRIMEIAASILLPRAIGEVLNFTTKLHIDSLTWSLHHLKQIYQQESKLNLTNQSMIVFSCLAGWKKEKGNEVAQE